MKNKQFERALDIIYPTHCAICDGVVPYITYDKGKIKRGTVVHRQCLKKAIFVRGNTCFKCGKPLGEDSDEEYHMCRYQPFPAGNIFVRQPFVEEDECKVHGVQYYAYITEDKDVGV